MVLLSSTCFNFFLILYPLSVGNNMVSQLSFLSTSSTILFTCRYLYLPDTPRIYSAYNYIWQHLLVSMLMSIQLFFSIIEPNGTHITLVSSRLCRCIFFYADFTRNTIEYLFLFEFLSLFQE